MFHLWSGLGLETSFVSVRTVHPPVLYRWKAYSWWVPLDCLCRYPEHPWSLFSSLLGPGGCWFLHIGWYSGWLPSCQLGVLHYAEGLLADFCLLHRSLMQARLVYVSDISHNIPTTWRSQKECWRSTQQESATCRKTPAGKHWINKS